MNSTIATRFFVLIVMNMKLCVLEIFSNLRRTIITSFGIFLGMASLLVLISFMRGMQKMVDDELVRMGGLNIVKVKTIAAQDAEERALFQRSPGLRLDQFMQLKNEIGNIDKLLLESDTGVRVSAMGRETRSRITALTPDHFPIYDYKISSGRIISQEDMNRAALVCVIGQRVADQLFRGVNPLGSSLNFMGKSFIVVGIIKTETAWDRRARSILYPYSVYKKYFASGTGEIKDLSFSIKDVSKLTSITDSIKERLTMLHRGVEDFEVVLNETRIEEQKKTSFALNALLTVLAILSLLIGGIGIMNIMFATIGDRIREIGLRKALGARKSDLFTQFLLEAIIVTSFGAIPGIVLGSVPALFLGPYLPIEPMISSNDYLLSLFFTIVTGILSGLFPAIKAASMNPVEALTHA